MHYAFVLIAAIGISGPALAVSAADSLPVPHSAVIDRSIPAPQREEMSLTARRYYAFWHTGDVAYADAALAPDFVDRTLPPGRPQGPEGPVFASKNFRTAVPDLRLEVEEMLIVGDRVSRGPSAVEPLHAKATVGRSTSSPPTSTASRTAASPKTGISRTT